MSGISLASRDNYMFDGNDMRYYRFKVSELTNGGNAREAKAQGLTLVRNGRLRRYYDATETLVYAYSYDTCIYARVYDVAEGFWRDVFNFTPYSATTRKHQNDLCREILGIGHWQWIEGRGPVTDDGYSYEAGGYVNVVYHEFPLQARRACEMVAVIESTSHAEYIAHADSFINRKEDDARVEARRQGVAA